MSAGVRMCCKQEACCFVFTAQHSIDEPGQVSWQGDLDIPISYGTFSKCSVLWPEKKPHNLFSAQM